MLDPHADSADSSNSKTSSSDRDRASRTPPTPNALPRPPLEGFTPYCRTLKFEDFVIGVLPNGMVTILRIGCSRDGRDFDNKENVFRLDETVMGVMLSTENLHVVEAKLKFSTL